jgi:hypothetical protein
MLKFRIDAHHFVLSTYGIFEHLWCRRCRQIDCTTYAAVW